MFDVSIFLQGIISIAAKIPVTLALTGCAAVFGFIMAVIFALIKMYRVRVLYHIVNALISFLRGTPLILQLYLAYYIIPMLYDSFAASMGWSFRAAYIPVFVLVVIAMGLNLSSFLAETIRSGLEAVNKGEIEAAFSLGMTGGMVFRRVLFPEAVRIFVPNFVSNLIVCLHGSSLAWFVTLVEITGQANIFAQFNWRYLEVFLAAGLFYWGITICIEIISHLAEQRLKRPQGFE
jgi:His/Glu/Gln/Arg/opine family amino acid ABC transporter permease subunit